VFVQCWCIDSEDTVSRVSHSVSVLPYHETLHVQRLVHMYGYCANMSRTLMFQRGKSEHAIIVKAKRMGTKLRA
jgi:hypothetical protein